MSKPAEIEFAASAGPGTLLAYGKAASDDEVRARTEDAVREAAERGQHYGIITTVQAPASADCVTGA